jgi:hypothetical protein
MEEKEETRMGKIDRSLLHGESFELFSAEIRSPPTRDPYERRLIRFLKGVDARSLTPSLDLQKIILDLLKIE